MIELLVAVGLFTVVMAISLGVIMSVIDGNKKSQSINSVSNNLNFAIESMVRDIKTGYEYRCNDELPVVKGNSSGCNASSDVDAISLISTISGEERSVKYQYNPAIGDASGYISKQVCSTFCTAENRLTSPEINITEMRLYVSDPPKQGQLNAGQPGVFLIIKGTARVHPTSYSDFNLQTFISQRILNI